MKLIQRIGYYLGGFSIGLVILAFFLNGKKVSCDYGPEARVLKNINSKEIKYSDGALNTIYEKGTDTIAINNVILNGSINFSKSNTRQEPCGYYVIEGYLNKQNVELVIENCDSIAALITMSIKE